MNNQKHEDSQLKMAKDIVIGFWQNELQHFQNTETMIKFHDVASRNPEELLDDYKAIKRILDFAINKIEEEI